MPSKKISHLQKCLKKASDRLENFFVYPTWVEENCKNFSEQNTACNMVKIRFEKYEKVEKIQNFEKRT